MKKLFYAFAVCLAVISALSLVPFNASAAQDVWVNIPSCSDVNYSGTVSWNDPQPNAAGFAVNVKSPERSDWTEWGRGVERGVVVTGQPPYSVPIPGQLHYGDDSSLVLKPGLTYTVKVSYTLAGDIGSLNFTVPRCPTPTPTKTATPSPATTKTPTPSPKTSSVATTCIDDAKLIASNRTDVQAPDSPNNINLEPEQESQLTITATNTGATKWYDGNYYKLINLAPKNTLGPTYGHLPNAVDPSGQVSWTFKVLAPTEPGTYPIDLRMVHISGGEYLKPNGSKCAAPASDKPFGQGLSFNLIVTSPNPSPSMSVTPIANQSETSGGFMGWLSDNWLLVLLILAILAGLGTWLWFSKNKSSFSNLPPPPPPANPSMPG